MNFEVVVTKQYCEVDYTFHKFQYHRNNVERLCPKVLGLKFDEVTKDEIQTSKKTLVAVDHRSGPSGPLEYEYDSCILTAKRMVDASCKLILLQESRKISSIDEFSLQRFFDGLISKKYNVKSTRICERCLRQLQFETKSAYQTILQNEELTLYLTSQWKLWIKTLNQERTTYQHRRSKDINSVTKTRKNFQDGSFEIQTSVPQMKSLVTLSSHLAEYYYWVLNWSSKHPLSKPTSSPPSSQ